MNRIDTAITKETVHHGRHSKVDRYKWVKLGNPGAFRMLPKQILEVDSAYQRGRDEEKVKRIAAGFSWPAFGVLIVASRCNGQYFVIEGQHRCEAANKRSDVVDVPCLVFEFDERCEEAAVFLKANTDRKPLTGVARHKASVEAGEPLSKFVNALVTSTGRTLVGAHHNGGRVVGCVLRLIKLAEVAPDRLSRLYPLIDSIVGDTPLNERVLEGLMWVESRMPPGQSLTDVRWRERMHSIGAEELDRAAKRSAVGFGKGGAGVWGRGMLEAINKGLKKRLVLEGVDEI